MATLRHVSRWANGRSLIILFGDGEKDDATIVGDGKDEVVSFPDVEGSVDVDRWMLCGCPGSRPL
jgi:hypothetical protein